MFATEQELIQSTGYSRATVREALRILADQGLIRTRPGPNGGIFVARPSTDHLARSLGIVLEASRVDLAQLIEARIELESTAGRLAAVRITSHQLKKLRDSCNRLAAALDQGDPDAFLQENLAFHTMLMEASHNEVLVLLHGAIRNLIRISMERYPHSPETDREVLRAHEAIVDGLDRHDPEVVATRIRKHLQAHQTELEANQYRELQRQFRI